MNSKTLLQKAQTKIQQKEQKKTSEPSTLILRLQNKPIPRVSWTQETIDNEHMNKKKSNLCCIYHRPGQSSSDTCTSDDQGNALQRDKHTKHLHKQVCSKRKNKQKKNQENKKENHQCHSQGHHHIEKKFLDE